MMKVFRAIEQVSQELASQAPARRAFRETVLRSFVAASLIGVIGCTQPGEKTGMGAAAGGALGAGLGAIIGSQTGDPGAGLVLGGAAGAASGALVGNALEAQENVLRSQDEAIERQDKLIAAQTRELQDLRKMDQDSMGELRSSLRQAPGERNAIVERPLPTDGRPSIPDSDFSDSARTEALHHNSGMIGSNHANERSGAAKVAGSGIGGANSVECKEADTERGLALTARETADKLFHLRRALRLCPSSAPLHHELGEVYVKLGRRADAQFEFQEALRLNPGQKRSSERLQQLASR